MYTGNLAYSIFQKKRELAHQKAAGLISDYSVSVEPKNFSASEDGALEHDIVVNIMVVPVTAPKEISITISCTQ